MIRAHPHSDLSYDEEFRPTLILELLFHEHKDWAQLKDFFNGVDANFRVLSNKQRFLDAKAAISRGNHKSSVTHHNDLSSNFRKEIRTGFQFPFNIEDMLKIKGTDIAPISVATQDVIDEHGRAFYKHRLTHDQSFDFSPGNSVNNRLIKETVTTL